MIDILLVDDRPSELMAMEAVLGCPDYNLVRAGSGQEVVTALSSHDFALVVLDVRSPSMAGFETARHIRQNAATHEMPIIFIAAIGDDSDQMCRAYEFGPADIFFKQMDPRILRSKIKMFYELCQGRMTLKKQNEELEARVRQRTTELVQTNNELEEFIYIASHDLQEPLRKIMIFGDRLKEDYSQSLDEPGKDYLERMRKASLRMKNVIEDLLIFSKIGTKEATFEKIDLHEVLEDILSDLEIKITQTHAKIEIGEMPTLVANKSQLHHLFQNLVANSIKFAQKDVTPHVIIESEAGQGMVEIRVRDNGIGFDEKYLDHIFKMFQRLHSQHEYEGSGIGLSICQKIAHQHGGKITARSKPGEGSTFIVTLPYHPQETPALAGAELATH